MNVAPTSRYYTTPLLLGLLLFVPTIGCNISFEQDPATTVKLEISGISEDADRDVIQDKLKGMVDGSSHSIRTVWSGDDMTINLSPVADAESFSKKIDFGEVTEVDGRTIRVQFSEST